ncbi:Unknown protein, partial [Striga hermonthica]
SPSLQIIKSNGITTAICPVPEISSRPELGHVPATPMPPNHHNRPTTFPWQPRIWFRLATGRPRPMALLIVDMSITSITWNGRGLANRATLAYLRSLIRDHRLDFVGFIEPMIRTPDFDYYSRRLGFQSGVGNTSHKIFFFHSRDYTCRVLRDTDQVLHIELSASHLPEPIFHTLVYAKCNRVGRYDLWDTLREIAESMEGLPWMVSGDFNMFLHPDERVGGPTDRSGRCGTLLRL